jgi:hypothetical protein
MNIRLGTEKPGMMSHTKVVTRALVGGPKKTWIGLGANRAASPTADISPNVRRRSRETRAIFGARLGTYAYSER